MRGLTRCAASCRWNLDPTAPGFLVCATDDDTRLQCVGAPLDAAMSTNTGFACASAHRCRSQYTSSDKKVRCSKQGSSILQRTGQPFSGLSTHSSCRTLSMVWLGLAVRVRASLCPLAPGAKPRGSHESRPPELQLLRSVDLGREDCMLGASLAVILCRQRQVVFTRLNLLQQTGKKSMEEASRCACTKSSKDSGGAG